MDSRRAGNVQNERREDTLMLEWVRAESAPPAESAELPCGCRGVVLSHDDASVHFGIERPACERHRPGDLAMVEKY